MKPQSITGGGRWQKGGFRRRSHRFEYLGVFSIEQSSNLCSVHKTTIKVLISMGNLYAGNIALLWLLARGGLWGLKHNPLPLGVPLRAQAELSSEGLDDEQSRRAANFQSWGRSGPPIAFCGDCGTLQWCSYPASSQKETSHPDTQLFQREGQQFKTASAHLLCK